MDFEADMITFNDPRDEWSHANTIVPLNDDRIMVSFRNTSTVGIVDRATGNFSWKLGYDVLSQQHDPNMLENGNILILDNGSHRKSDARTPSRVIEVDPATDEIVWEYRDQPAFNFFSPYISGARRLPNGNTLITEGNFGRLFQVTPKVRSCGSTSTLTTTKTRTGIRRTPCFGPPITCARTFRSLADNQVSPVFGSVAKTVSRI